MKDIFAPDLPWFDSIDLWLDLGFFGATADYGKKAKIYLPHKKPRKSKNNPSPKLTETQKQNHREQAKIRVAVEHAIGGMKHFHCLTHRIRNHLDSFIDNFFWLSAGLWNLKNI
jgi:DDE superfamily endonuclease